jgi:hypothetical protein
LLDPCGAALPLPHSAVFSAGVDERAHRLFGLVAQRWNIAPAIRAFSADARSVPPAANADPLVAASRRAQGAVLAELSAVPKPG